MRLRNKRTGEIGWLYCDHTIDPKKIVVFAKERDFSSEHWDYDSIAKLNEEWEDAPEEPKEFWFVDADGDVRKTDYLTANDKSNLKDFGNYFETKEKADKAVEKLKTWKRLKDKGFKFEYFRWERDQYIKFHIDENSYNGLYDDLDLLFSKED